ncbi:EscU/YscU/HrcU family type III secretion system export apparatus switch protein [Alicyclobacillus cycloheptanicus]|nr:EscU/YscU/HrcU family type III secretion system export apparatus switch protein [Alicyclobacillus cycloheptanicus]WDM02772.1 EscU/YscU/HrcU family type III secretion system export apparatus switch protein [Alicyclobacillus cycloheptanicus]
MPPKRAVALRYERHRDAAPRVVAKGVGEVAEAILRQAEAGNVAVHENESLVNALFQLETDQVIPQELYAVVAEVLAIVYRRQTE